VTQHNVFASAETARAALNGQHHLGNGTDGQRERANGHDNAPIVRKLSYVRVNEIEDADIFDDELIEGVIGRIAMAVLYGDSNCGKTFLAVEMAARLSLAEDFLGRHTAGGVVLYLATEGVRSVKRRFRAWTKMHGRALPNVFIVQSPINLYDGAADVTAVLAVIDEIEAKTGSKVELVIGDTLARISAGANENSGQDMGVVMRNAELIKEGARATFLWVHHSGKDAARGMRGWSGMRAAIDTEIEITVTEGTGARVAEATKQRDLPGKGDRFGFELEFVALACNQWGTTRGSCVVRPTDAPAKAHTSKRRSEVAGAIEEFLTLHGAGCLKGALAKHFQGRYVRTSIYREIVKMIDSGELIEAGGIVTLPGRPGSVA
jgi:putative DNA primase/helicase